MDTEVVADTSVDTGAAPAAAPATPDVGAMSEADYANQRSSYEKEHGSGSWLRHINEAPADPAKPNGAAKPAEAKTAAAQPTEATTDDGEMEPGEITINADGKPIDTKTGRFVPKSVMLRYKGEAKEAKATIDTLRTQVIQARERLSLFEEATKPKDEPKPELKPVDPKEDIFGAYEYVAKQLAALQEQLTNTTKTTEAQLTETRNRDAFVSDARRFAAQEPTFTEAFGFLRAQYDAELEAMGIADKDQRDARLTSELRNFVDGAIANKQSPAELLFKRAKARGYQPKPAQPQGESEAEKKAREEIERINAGKAASATLGGAGGGVIADKLDINKLASMPEGEYYETRKAFIAKHGQTAWNKLTNAM